MTSILQALRITTRADSMLKPAIHNLYFWLRKIAVGNSNLRFLWIVVVFSVLTCNQPFSNVLNNRANFGPVHAALVRVTGPIQPIREIGVLCEPWKALRIGEPVELRIPHKYRRHKPMNQSSG